MIFSEIFFLIPFLATAFLFVLLLLFVLMLGERRNPDPRGRRPYATFLFSVIFVGLLGAVAGIGLTASGAANAISNTGGRGCFAVAVPARQLLTPEPEPSFSLPEFTPPTFSFPTISLPPLPSFSPQGEIRPQPFGCPGHPHAAAAVHGTLIFFAAAAVAGWAAAGARELIAKEAQG